MNADNFEPVPTDEQIEILEAAQARLQKATMAMHKAEERQAHCRSNGDKLLCAIRITRADQDHAAAREHVNFIKGLIFKSQAYRQ